MDNKKKTLNICAFAMAVVICMIAAVVCCSNKQAMHEDEFYSYYSSNRTYGLIAEGTVSRDTVMDELTVRSGEGFNFSLVKEVQSWDVHPPVYYFILHFVSSMTQGVFSKWQGLIINLICLLVALLLMKKLGDMLMPDYPIAVDIASLAWGISAATLTGVVFIRMYMLLTVWILAVTILHVSPHTRIVLNDSDSDSAEMSGSDRRMRLWFWPVLGVLTFLGFMTHYYFFIWLFFLAAFWNIREIIITRRIRTTVIYGVTMIITFGLCYLFYPAFPAQMFHGQRGAQATGNFFDLGNTWERICFFAEKVNRIGFGRALWILLLSLISFWVIYKINGARKQHNTGNYGFCLPLLCVAGAYFLVVSKTALILGDSSIRYQMPVLGIAYLCIFAWLGSLLRKAKEGTALKRHGSTILCILAALLIILNIYTDLTGNISFLYPERDADGELLSEYIDSDAYYVYPSGQSWIIWADMTELLMFEEVTYIPEEQFDNYAGASGVYFIDRGIDIPADSDLTFLFSGEYSDVYISTQ